MATSARALVLVRYVPCFDQAPGTRPMTVVLVLISEY